jgi:hypothetical protein
MADFCRQCSLENFGEDYGDLANLIPDLDFALGYCAVALCEGCGPTVVNKMGMCLSGHCLRRHHAPFP